MNAIANLPGYQITKELYTGTRTLVYRGIRTSDQHPVVIKILRNEYPNFNELIQFRNQYTIAKNLNFPSIVQPLALEVYQNSYALVMEDFGGISLSDYLTTFPEESNTSNYLPLTEFLKIAIQLTETLHYLYQNRIIHKDIKPVNILINSETKAIQLIDFSISSLLPRETEEIQNANSLEGSLAYLSPEQTGRMNRGIDYRSDFYSLGVTFYELLTGTLPFSSTDAMELVHCHLAKQPIPIHKINPEIPLVLSEIVTKLMAKDAEKRYQSALGIKQDLDKCLTQLQKIGQIEYFQIGRGDLSDRFIIPEKLYGRENEVNQLLTAFERVSIGGTEMMLVAGFSGIGKTAVINEVHKPIVRERGYFIKGKYDQFQRNIPFSAFVQAFRDLMGQLLSESDVQIQTWKNHILTAVGDNGQVLIDVIPELVNIIGKQPPVLELSGSAAQNRFNLLLQKFVQVFTKKEHPLVMFLDDLQWADSASLNLLKLLMQDTGHLLILGAYRDNEVSPVHPFILTVDEIIKAGATVNTISLSPLSEPDLNQLVADTLNCQSSLAQPLTELIYQKTKGNPFFATQFLKALHDDKLITFNWNIQNWQCDIAQVNALALTDDVVEFMAWQLQKLPTETQGILKLAACIGTKFDLHTLAIVSEKLPESTANALWKALQEGLVIPTSKIYKFFTKSDSNDGLKASANPSYRFLHDRVQQAAYSLIPDEQKQQTHYHIGQLLQQNLSEVEKEKKLFDIVGHFNLGIELINQPEEREALARLNLAAGEKAKNSTAYSAARNFVQTGLDLLPDNCWQSQYELTLNLYVAAAETAYLNGDFDGMEEMANQVLQLAQTILDRVKIYEIQISALTAKSQMMEAIAVGTIALAQLGIELPSQADQALTGKALQTLASQLQGKQIEELVNLPAMSDPQIIAAMQLLAMLFPPIFMGNPALLPLFCATMVSLSLQFGNAPASTIGYVGYGMVLSAFFGEIETGYCFGRLALSLLNQLKVREFKPITLLWFGCFIQHRQEALRATIPMLKESYLAGIETGDFLNAGYSIINYSYNNLFAGVEIEAWEAEIENYCVALTNIKQYSPVAYLKVTQQMGHNLKEIVNEPDLLIGTAYDETEMVPKHHQDNELTVIAFVYIYKLILAYLFGKYNNALASIEKAKIYLMAVAGVFHTPIFHFYAALTYLALCSTQSEIEQADTLALVETHHTNLAQWAHHAPMNHQHKVDLIEAEKCRVFGKNYEAGDWYDRAIAGAKENEYIQEEALANELAAKFYLAWGKEKVAAGYMQDAYYCYARWGAKAKTDELERRYPQLLRSLWQRNQLLLNPQQTINVVERLSNHNYDSNFPITTSASQILDLSTILKACQAISSEIQHDRLLAKLTQVLMENAGATKCALILCSDSEWQIEALATVEEAQEITYLSSQPLESTNDLPISLVRYVANTLEMLVFDEMAKEKKWNSDRYVQSCLPKSVLCLPVLKQSTLIAILYLENNRTPAAFTPQQQEILKLLITQISISIENASLYRSLEEKVKKRTAELEASEAKLQEAQKLAHLGNWEWDLLTNQVDWSNEMYRIFGLEKAGSETIIEKHKQQIHPEDFPTWLTGIELLQREGEPYNFDFRIIHSDGELRYIYAKGQAEKDPQGKVLKIFGTAQDISDRKLIEEALRTSERELREKATQLEQTLRELRQTQSQLIQTEKMSSLGEMVAGVAHEINNPVSFIYGNIEPASHYINDLLDLIRTYQNSYPESTPEIDNKIQEIDLDFLVDDLVNLLGSMKKGAKRIRDIVASLRNFSRLDESEIKSIDIHEGIEATLLILQYRLHAFQENLSALKFPEIMVIKDYSNLPFVVCYPNQLNQVFLNILNNAIDALNQVSILSENANFTPTIKITTATPEAGFIEIKISDNGLGIPPEIENRIFEPFFTTKPVGSGTGLGLYVSYQIIVEHHCGTLSCVSNPGVGTEFIIKIPILHHIGHFAPVLSDENNV